jgi:hypothetical protein
MPSGETGEQFTVAPGERGNHGPPGVVGERWQPRHSRVLSGRWTPDVRRFDAGGAGRLRRPGHAVSRSIGPGDRGLGPPCGARPCGARPLRTGRCAAAMPGGDLAVGIALASDVTDDVLAHVQAQGGAGGHPARPRSRRGARPGRGALQRLAHRRDAQRPRHDPAGRAPCRPCAPVHRRTGVRGSAARPRCTAWVIPGGRSPGQHGRPGRWTAPLSATPSGSSRPRPRRPADAKR